VGSISVMGVIRSIHLNRGGIIIGKSANERIEPRRDERGARGVCEICERVVLGWVDRHLIGAEDKDAYGLGDWARSRASLDMS
jgi:hypothetical protein